LLLLLTGESVQRVKWSNSWIYRKQALVAQKKYELTSVIEYWDEVLALDGGNENARLY